jgi:signal transduction histidine kinase
VDHAALTAVELLLDTDPTDPPSSLAVTIDVDPDRPAIELRYGRSARVPIGPVDEQALVPLRTPRWYQIAPAPYGMPWVAITLLNAFSVLAATLAAGTGLWLAALADMVVITTGTAGLDRLLRWRVIQRLSARRQWLVIASVVAAVGALAGGVWGTLIGGETTSLAVLGLVCALSMGLFLPGIRVWASEIRRLRAGIVLDDLATEATAIRQRVRSLTAATAAAESLHATVQSQLLGVAGAIGSDVPPELRALALSTLDGVVNTALPAIANQLETAPVAISMEVPSELPPVALTLLNSVIVEAVGNAVQHGQADAVTVEATLWPGALAITIEDDGIGIPPQARDGLGLTAIRSVASEFSLLPRPRGGTRLDIRLPFLA